MEDQKGPAVRASSSCSAAAAVAAPAPPPPLPALTPPPPPPPQPSSSSAVAAAAAPKEEPLPPADGGQRVRFSVELKPGETTIVSWKRLLKESNKVAGSLPIASVAMRPLAVQVGTGAPVGEPSSSPKEAPKRRRRRDSTKLHGDGSHVLVPGGPAKVGSMRIKDAARNAPVMGRKPSPAKVYAPYGEHYSEEGRSLKYKSKTTTTVYKRKSADFTIKSEEQSTMRVPNKDVLSLPLELKYFDKHKSGVLASEDSTHRASVSHSFDPLYQASRSKGQVEFQPKKLLKSETGEVSAKIRRKEKYSSNAFPAMNSSASVYPMHAVVSTSLLKNLSVLSIALPLLLQASQGKISEDELIDRLMGILGHLVQRKTLK
ncbi:hypothetical protein BHE74_00038559, partial [Ensete ventricosum]